MRFYLAGAVAASLFYVGTAQCQTSRTSIQSVEIALQGDVTSIVIETSRDTQLRIIPQTDRIDIEFPQAGWHAQPPQINRRSGLIKSFRKVPVTQGVHLVFMTRSEYGVRDSAPVAIATNGDRIYTISLGAPSIAPLVTVVGDAPVIIQGNGYIPPAAAKSAPAIPVQSSTECVSRLIQQGSIDGKPVLGYGNCPASPAQ